MNERRPASAVAIAFAVLAVLLGTLYVGGYVGLSTPSEMGGAKIRYYRRPWLRAIFVPAGMVESVIIRRGVYVVWDDSDAEFQ